MVTMSLFSRSLLIRYPLSIQSALLDDTEFTQRLGLDTASVFRFANSISAIDEQLFTAVRSAFRHSNGSSFEDRKGQKVRVYLRDATIELAVAGNDLPPISVREFSLLSPNAEDRIQTLRKIIEQCGPSAPDFSSHLKTAETRELTNAEASEILTELHQGVAVHLATAATAFLQGRAAVEDLIPGDLNFFERFCGPNPEAADVQTYVNNILPEYRRCLLSRNVSLGLDVCLVGALHHDLSPGPWLDSVSDDDVWAALDKPKFLHDPYSLLGTLDLTLRRRHDKRFHALAEDVIAALCEDALTDNDGNDVYELMPLFAQLTLHQLNTMEDGLKRAPFWKNMCAWMHGGMLARLSRNSGVDAKGMKEWIQGRITRAGVIANILDLRHEPMFSALAVTKAALRGEVLGRLARIHSQYGMAAETLPAVRSMEETLRKAEDPEMAFMSISPGPLEGNRRPQVNHTDKLLSFNRKELFTELKERPLGPVWSWLAQVAQVCRLDEEMLAAGRDAIRDALIPDHVSLRGLGLSDVLLVAISTPDIELRDAVAERLVGLADRIKSADDGAWLAQTIVLASAAVENDEEWENWLRKMLADVAVRLPLDKETLLGFISTLEAIEKVVPARAGITAKARATVIAAL
jgi:hypothetical protein